MSSNEYWMLVWEPYFKQLSPPELRTVIDLYDLPVFGSPVAKVVLAAFLARFKVERLPHAQAFALVQKCFKEVNAIYLYELADKEWQEQNTPGNTIEATVARLKPWMRDLTPAQLRSIIDTYNLCVLGAPIAHLVLKELITRGCLKVTEPAATNTLREIIAEVTPRAAMPNKIETLLAPVIYEPILQPVATYFQ